MSLFERFEQVVQELSRRPELTLSRQSVVRSARDGVPMSVERETARSVGILLEPALEAMWEDVASVDIEWHANEAYGALVIPDSFALEDAFVLPEEGSGDATFLSELHLIECRSGDHWTAFRTEGLASGTIVVDRMELWKRIPGTEGALDLRLRADWSEYLERMLLTRGAEQFALTLVEDAEIPKAERKRVQFYLRRFCEAASLVKDERLAELIAHTQERARRITRSTG